MKENKKTFAAIFRMNRNRASRTQKLENLAIFKIDK